MSIQAASSSRLPVCFTARTVRVRFLYHTLCGGQYVSVMSAMETKLGEALSVSKFKGQEIKSRKT